MRGAKFLGHTAKRRKKTGRCKPSGPLCRFHGELPSGCPRCAVLVAPPSLRGSCCAASAGLESMPFPPPLSVAPHPPGRGACRFRFPSPLPLSVAPPGCVVPVVAPLRAPGRAGDHAASVRHPSSIGLLPSCCLCRVVLPPPCRAAGFIAWRPAPDRSAGPRCRAPCGRCLPRSPTR